MENRIEYIERYFNGQLTGEEIAEFEEKRYVDKEFDKEVKLYQKAIEVIRVQAKDRMKQGLDNIGRQEKSVELVSSFIRYRVLRKYWLQVAASIIIISGMTYFAISGITQLNQSFNLDALYGKYYDKPGIDQVVTRSSERENSEEVWNSALEKYDRSDYTGAIIDFKLLLNSSNFTHKSAAHFFAGISYLNLNIPDSAIMHLSNVSQSSAFSDQAGWYLGLSNIRAGNSLKASELFKQIRETENHPDRKNASKLVKELKKLEKRAKTE